MIHIAPCSCELHQALREALERNRADELVLKEAFDKIRELEAQVEEMVLANRQWIKAGKEAQARAEKAEADLKEAIAELGHAQGSARAEANAAQVHYEARQRLEARVAELERQLDEARSPDMHEYGDDCYEFVAENPPEREAD